MNEKPKCQDDRYHKVMLSASTGNQCLSALAPSEPPAPQGSLRCDGVVGLRASEAEALVVEWETRADKCKEREAEANAAGQSALALCAEVRGLTYKLCAAELRLRAGLPVSRQPEPNEKAQPRAE